MKKVSILKIIFFTLLTSFSTFNTKAQNEWIPEGAIWYYSFNSFWNVGYLKHYYTHDTVINGLEYKAIATQHVVYNHLEDSVFYYDKLSEYHIRTDSNIVYLYYQNLDTLYVLYDFNSQVGDTWKIPPHPHVTTYDTTNFGSFSEATVTDIDYVYFNGDSLKRYHIENSIHGNYELVGPIVEKFGSMYWPFPYPKYIVDLYNAWGLRCYEDIHFTLYNFDPSVPCDFTVSINYLEKAEDIQIVPNPASRFIDILGLNQNNLNVQIYDILGRLVIEKTVNEHNNRIIIEDLPNGVNFLKVNHENTLYVKMFLKN